MVMARLGGGANEPVTLHYVLKKGMSIREELRKKEEI